MSNDRTRPQSVPTAPFRIRDMVKLDKLVEDDLSRVAKYWMLRKFQFLDAAQTEFETIVDPALAYVDEPDAQDIFAYNTAFTEWLLFERPYRRRRSLLGCYVDEPPVDVPEDVLDRLRQVDGSQLFSRFSILDKNVATSMCVLRDTRTDRRYDVFEPHLAEVGRWREGVIAERIAEVDGLWLGVGQMYLYDVAPAGDVGPDGPGAVHIEDAEDGLDTSYYSFYLRLVRDTMGAAGRYTPSLKIDPGDA